MPRADADRNLLFGILALQMDFITRDGLIAAMNAWALEKHRPLGEVLVEHGALAPEFRALLEPMVAAHVDRHGGDPAASLAALNSAGGLAADLRRSVADPDVLDSLATVAPAPSADPHATRAPGASRSTLEGDDTVAPGPAGPRSPGTRYTKVRDHARGGLGVVFVARDAELNREVALKEIQDRHADDPASRSRFLVEAEVTGGLEHPGIVPVYGLGRYEDGRPFYAMRFIRGDSLREAAAAFHADPALKADPGRRALALQKLLRRFLDVCNAVEYAHSRGVLHRDLKPDNVMVGKYGETLVVDWGLAKAGGMSGEGDAATIPESPLQPASASGSAETLPGSVVGTPAFMSPEQAEGQADRLGPASDVYSLGATLYALLTGAPPFSGKDLTQILADVRGGRFPRPREVDRRVPPALEAVCLKAMATAPEGRYPSPRALAEDVERWLADERVSAFAERWPARLARWGRRHRPLVAGASALVATAAVALAASTALIAREQVRTRQQKDLAEFRFDQARRAVDDLLTRVAESPQLATPGLQPLRRRLLGQALLYYQDFVEQDRKRGVDSRATLADALDRVARIDELVGDREKALVAAREALAARERLAADRPAEAAQQSALVAAHDRLGSIQLATGRPAEAAESYRKALGLAEGLVRARPGDPGPARLLAGTSLQLADWHHRAGRRAEALAASRRALELGEKLASADDLTPEGRGMMARAHRLIGYIQAETRELDEGLRSLERSRALWEAAPKDDPQARAELAELDHRIGAILHADGRLDGAMLAYQRARDAREALVALNSVAQHQSDLAKDYDDIAVLQAQLKKPDDSLLSNRRALDLREMLVRQYGTVTEYKRDLADSHNAIGRLHRQANRPAEALREHRAALEILEPIARDVPGSAGALGDLATTLESLGTLQRAPAPAEAAATLARALEIRERMARDQPSDPQVRRSLANGYNSRAGLMLELKRPGDAVDACTKARDVRLGITRDHPDDHDSRSALALTLQNLALTLDRAGRRPEGEPALVDAIGHQRAAIARAPEPQARAYRGRLGGHYAQLARLRLDLGNPAGSAAAAIEHAEALPDQPDQLARAAAELAACLRPIEADATRPEEARRAESARLADRALAILKKALELGPVDPKLADDPALAPLWARPEAAPLREAIRQKAGAPK